MLPTMVLCFSMVPLEALLHHMQMLCMQGPVKSPVTPCRDMISSEHCMSPLPPICMGCCAPVQGEGAAAAIPDDDRSVLLRASHFGPEGMLRLTGSRLARRLDAPLPSLFWAAGLSFARARMLQEVRAMAHKNL